MSMDPKAIREWQKIFRDLVIVLVGVFILIHETLTSGDPNIYLVGAGLAALGLPPALRLDQERKSKGGNGDEA